MLCFKILIPVRHQTSDNPGDDMAGDPAFRGITPDFDPIGVKLTIYSPLS